MRLMWFYLVIGSDCFFGCMCTHAAVLRPGGLLFQLLLPRVMLLDFGIVICMFVNSAHLIYLFVAYTIQLTLELGIDFY